VPRTGAEHTRKDRKVKILFGGSPQISQNSRRRLCQVIASACLWSPNGTSAHEIRGKTKDIQPFEHLDAL